jgi:hypothetical protein
MIHVATVHWMDPKWIAPQNRGLSSFVEAPHRTYANLQGIDKHFDNQFSQVTRNGGTHADKLNELARLIADQAAADDLLIFVDGDAFPIRPIDQWTSQLLSERPLAAVRRDENAGDVQPHPCFCVTTVGFWRDIDGDWRPGPWTTDEGLEASDVGGRLLSILDQRSIAWRPILRSNTLDVHPLLYGIYDRHIYHHGAGFRPPIARVDEANVPVSENEEYLYLRTQARTKSLKDLRISNVGKALRLGRDSFRARKLNAYIRREGRRSDEIYQAICEDPDFYLRFERTEPVTSKALTT